MSIIITFVISVFICIALVILQIKCANNNKVIISIMPMVLVFVIITGIFGKLYVDNSKMEIKECRYNLSNGNYAQMYIKFTKDKKADVFSEVYIRDENDKVLDKLHINPNIRDNGEATGIYSDIEKYFVGKYDLKGLPLDVDQLKYIHKTKGNMVITIESKGIVYTYLLVEGPLLIIWLLIKLLKKYRNKKREIEKLQFELSIEQ